MTNSPRVRRQPHRRARADRRAAAHFLVAWSAPGRWRPRAEPAASQQESRQSVAALEHHEGCGMLGDARAFCRSLGRQESFSKEAVGRKPRDCQRGQHRGGPGRRRDRLRCHARRAPAGSPVGDDGVRRRTPARRPRPRRSCPKFSRTPRRCDRDTASAGPKTVVIEQLASRAYPQATGRPRRDLERAQRHVAQVSDRGLLR